MSTCVVYSAQSLERLCHCCTGFHGKMGKVLYGKIRCDQYHIISDYMTLCGMVFYCSRGVDIVCLASSTASVGHCKQGGVIDMWAWPSSWCTASTTPKQTLFSLARNWVAIDGETENAGVENTAPDSRGGKLGRKWQSHI